MVQVMSQQQRSRTFYSAVVSALILVIVGVLYLAGYFIPTGKHNLHALLAFVLACGLLVFANFIRPTSSGLS